MVFVSLLKAHPAPAAAVAVALAALTGLIIWLVVRRRPTPEELEKRRRLMVNRDGRTVEGEISDADPHRLYYIYTVRGVEYAATQDIDSLLEFLPCEPCRVVGEIGVRYLRNNPANSIVVCEEWSGLPPRLLPASEQAENEHSRCPEGGIAAREACGIPACAAPRSKQKP